MKKLFAILAVILFCLGGCDPIFADQLWIGGPSSDIYRDNPPGPAYPKPANGG